MGGVVAVAFAAQPGAAPTGAPERSTAQLEQSIARAASNRGAITISQPMCMRRSLDQAYLPLPSFGWECDLSVSGHGLPPASLRLTTLNVSETGCWRFEGIQTITGPRGAAKLLTGMIGCLNDATAGPMPSMAH